METVGITRYDLRILDRIRRGNRSPKAMESWRLKMLAHGLIRKGEDLRHASGCLIEAHDITEAGLETLSVAKAVLSNLPSPVPVIVDAALSDGRELAIYARTM
jgi:hypothetical protein